MSVDRAITMRTMTRADIPASLRLSEQTGWNQTAADWGRLLRWEPEGCFVAERDGQVVGTVTATVYGARLAWVGMMLVDAAARRQGLGRALLTHAIEWLEAVRGVQTVALDATPLGKTLYDDMGFVDQLSLQRYEGTAAPLVAPAGVRPLNTSDVPRLGTLDASAFGADRLRVLQSLVEAEPTRCHLLERDGVIEGYVYGRPGARAAYVGPLAAKEPETAETLLRAALAPLGGQPVFLDLPDDNPHSARLAERFDLRPQRRFIRMARGAPLPPADISRCYAIAGPEIG
jgi:GNAT superfamily N-acetyltransferase